MSNEDNVYKMIMDDMVGWMMCHQLTLGDVGKIIIHPSVVERFTPRYVTPMNTIFGVPLVISPKVKQWEFKKK